jgi:hypothetical protein
MVLHKFMHVMNDVFRNQIQWAQRNNLSHVMEGLKLLLGMLGIQRVINISQLHIHKPKLHPFVRNYTSFKFKAYYM